MRGKVLLDTGPLVAFLDQRDPYHAWAKNAFAEITPPLLTCEGVVSEACHLAKRAGQPMHPVLELFDRGAVCLAFRLDGHLAPIASLLERYADVPMSLADACLVRMSEMTTGSTVFTMDSDFRVYRRHRREPIPLLIPTDR